MKMSRAKEINSNVPQRAALFSIRDTVKSKDSPELGVGIVMGVELTSDEDGIDYTYAVQFSAPAVAAGEWDGPSSEGTYILEQHEIQRA
mgnify:CR=1 FL=1